VSRTLRRIVAVLAVIGVVVTLVAVGVHSLMTRIEIQPAQQARCDVVNSPYTLSTEQAANAATISAVVTRRRLPPAR